MNGHEHHDHDDKPETPAVQDAGSKALTEALGSSLAFWRAAHARVR